MTPSLFKLVNVSGVQALLGTNPLRVFEFGEANPKPAMPYAVWQTIAGDPVNRLSGRPDMDSFTVQVDVYAKTAPDALAVGRALIDALEPEGYISYNGESRDPDSKDYRYSFSVDLFTAR